LKVMIAGLIRPKVFNPQIALLTMELLKLLVRVGRETPNAPDPAVLLFWISCILLRLTSA